MKFTKALLKNGLRIITVPMADTKTATVLIVVGAGAKYENKKINGISHFLEHLFFKGTKKRPTSLQIATLLDEVGAEWNAWTGKEATGFFIKVANKHLLLALDILADIFQNSIFDGAEMEKERNVIQEEIKLREDTPVAFLGTLFERLLYGEQPAGRDVLGTPATVKSITREQIVQYRQQHYTAKNSVICVAGNFGSQAAAAGKVKRYFCKINPEPARPKKAVQEQQKKPAILIHQKKTDQAHLGLGVRGYHLFHPDRFVLQVLSVILGAGMSSRLFEAIRERAGLAYYVRTNIETASDSGYLLTQAGVDHQKVEQAIKIVLREYQRLQKEKAPGQELKKAKEYIKGKVCLGLECSEEVAHWCGEQEILMNKILTPEEIFKKIEAVSAGDIQRVARDIFQNKKLNLAIIGPFAHGQFKKNLHF